MARVVFLHPDLGIGGAERLVVDAALALQSKGHQVSVQYFQSIRGTGTDIFYRNSYLLPPPRTPAPPVEALRGHLISGGRLFRAEWYFVSKNVL